MGTSSRARRLRSAVRLGKVPAGLVALLGIVALPAASSASASTQVVSGTTPFAGIACVSTSTCFGVTEDLQANEGGIVTITAGVPGPVIGVPGTGHVRAIACATAATCVAVGDGGSSPSGAVLLVAGGLPGTSLAASGTATLTGVACPTPSLCVATGVTASTEGVLVPITISGSGAAAVASVGAPVTVAQTASLDALACPDAADCIAAGASASGGLGAIVPITIATSPVSLSPGTVATSAGSFTFFGLACPLAATCVAVGSGGEVATYSGVLGGGASPAQSVAGVKALSGIACPEPTSCIAVGNSAADGMTVSVADASGTPSTATAYSSAEGFGGVACPTTTTCIAVGRGTGGTGTVTTVAGPAPGTPTSAPGSAGLSQLDCTGAGTCVGVGAGPSTAAGGVATAVVDGFAYPASPVAGTTALNGLVCPTAASCVAVGATTGPTAEGAVVALSANPDGTVTRAGIVLPVASTVTLDAIACPATSSACVAVGSTVAGVGAVVPVTVQASGTVISVTAGAATTVAGTADLAGVACPSPGTCVATGATSAVGGEGVVVPVSVGAGTATPGTATLVASTSQLVGIACGTSTGCLATGTQVSGASALGVVVPVSLPGGTPTPGGADVVPATSALGAVSCPTGTACEAAGTGSPAALGLVVPVALSPGTAAPGTVTAVAGSSQLSGISCPTAATCQAAGIEQFGLFGGTLGLFASVPLDTDLALATAPPVVAVATSPAGGSATFPLPTATDPSDGGSAPTASCTPASGSTFPVGTTTVTCSGTDLDDTPPTTTSTFTVTIQAPPPAVLSPGETTPPASTSTGSTPPPTPAPPAPPAPPRSSAPPPGDLPSSAFAGPASGTVAAGTPTRLSGRLAGGGTASVDVPAGGLPSGSVVSLYPVGALASLGRRVPAGQVALAAFGLSWVGPTGTAIGATVPVTTTVSDPAIHPGDRVEEVTSTGLRLVGEATRSGVVAVTSDGTGTFVVVAWPRMSPSRPVVGRAGGSVAMVLGCDAGASCRGRATLSVARRVTRHGSTAVAHVALAVGHLSIRAGDRARIELRLTAFGRRLLQHRPHGVAVSLLTVLAGGGRQVRRVVVPS